MKTLALLLLLSTPALAAGNDTYISIVNRTPPLAGNTEDFTAVFTGSGPTTGVKPTWSVSGAAATFIYADSTQLKVHVVLSATPPSGQLQFTVTATIPETPPITVKEVKPINLGGS